MAQNEEGSIPEYYGPEIDFRNYDDAYDFLKQEYTNTYRQDGFALKARRLRELSNWTDFDPREREFFADEGFTTEAVTEDYGEEMAMLFNNFYLQDIQKGGAVLRYDEAAFNLSLESYRQAGMALDQIREKDATDKTQLAALGVSAEAMQLGTAKNILKNNIKEGLQDVGNVLARGKKASDALQKQISAEEENQKRQEEAGTWGVIGGVVGAAVGSQVPVVGTAAGYGIGQGLGSLAGSQD